MMIYLAITALPARNHACKKQRRKNKEYAQRSYALKGVKKKQKQEAKARVKRQCVEDDEGRKQHNTNTAARVRKSRDKMPNEKRMDQSKEPRTSCQMRKETMCMNHFKRVKQLRNQCEE